MGAARRAKEGIEWVKKKNWKWSADFLMGKQLTGSRIGILGMGRIGRAVASIARSFGMKIHYHNRSRLNKNLEKNAIYHKSLKSLLSVSDFKHILRMIVIAVFLLFRLPERLRTVLRRVPERLRIACSVLPRPCPASSGLCVRF